MTFEANKFQKKEKNDFLCMVLMYLSRKRKIYFRRNNMYEKIKSWISNNRFLVGMGVGAVLFLACYLFGRTSVSDNRSRTNDTGTKLEQAVSNQQSISQGIADSQRTVESIGSGIDRSQTAERAAAEAVDRAGSLVEESRKLAERNLEILATIRTRGPTGSRNEN